MRLIHKLLRRCGRQVNKWLGNLFSRYYVGAWKIEKTVSRSTQKENPFLSCSTVLDPRMPTEFQKWKRSFQGTGFANRIIQSGLYRLPEPLVLKIG
jgi:hypothetical protein